MVRPIVSVEVEAAFVVERIRAAACPPEEIAILCRTNSRLVDFEQALHEAGIPFQGAAFLGREAARFLLRRLRDGDGRVDEQVRSLALAQGWVEVSPEGLGEREQIRQDDLQRLVQAPGRAARSRRPASTR